MNYNTLGSNPYSVSLVDASNVSHLMITEKALSDAAISLFDVPLPAGAMFGCIVFWNIQASDGTDHQAFTGITSISSVNKAGSYTDVVTSLSTVQAKAVSSGTQTGAFTVVDGTNKITVVMTPVGSLTEVVYRLNYTVLNLSRQPIIVL